MKDEGYTLLNISIDSEWNATLENHKDAGVRYSKFNLTSQELSSLKGACETELEKTDISKENYEKVKKWCVKPITVGDLIKAKKLKILDTTKSDETDKTQWKPLADEYVNKGKGDYQIEGLTLPLSSGNREDDWKQLRTKCGNLISTDFWSEKYESELSKAIMWCTEKD